MFSHHLIGLSNRTVAAVLAHLERTITPSALRDPADVRFKGISIYRADPTGTIGIATSSHRRRRRDLAAPRNGARRVAMP
jgi:hypothetical protein